jgi:hypothetical protein
MGIVLLETMAFLVLETMGFVLLETMGFLVLETVSFLVLETLGFVLLEIMGFLLLEVRGLLGGIGSPFSCGAATRAILRSKRCPTLRARNADLADEQARTRAGRSVKPDWSAIVCLLR